MVLDKAHTNLFSKMKQDQFHEKVSITKLINKLKESNKVSGNTTTAASTNIINNRQNKKMNVRKKDKIVQQEEIKPQSETNNPSATSDMISLDKLINIVTKLQMEYQMDDIYALTSQDLLELKQELEEKCSEI